MQNYGKLMACLEHGAHPGALPFQESVVDKLNDHNEINYGALQKMACHFAAQVFEQIGEKVSPYYCLYDQLRKSASWYPEMDCFSDPVFNALNNVSKESTQMDVDQGESLFKQAALVSVLDVIGKTIGATPALTKTLMAGSVAAGSGLGALYWALNNHANEDDKTNESTKAKIKLYRRIAAEIQNDLNRQAELKSKDPASIIHQNAGTDNII